MKYVQLEIRVDKIISVSFRDYLKKNTTSGMNATVIDGLEFTWAEKLPIRGKKFIMAIDSEGYANYFLTRNFKHFNFHDRVPIGGIPREFAKNEDENVIH